jgi:hypothetical protein
MTPFGSISLVLQRFVHKSVHKFRVATARHSAARRADREPNLRTRRIIVNAFTHGPVLRRYWFNPSIAHQTHCRSEAVVEAPIWSRAKHMPNEGRRLGANHEEPRMTITPTTVPEPGGARLRRAMGAGRRKKLGLSAPPTRTLPQPVSASSTGSVT